MAADSAPRDRMAYAIGFVQTAQRLGPAIGPIVGGAVAQIAGLRNAFLVTAVFLPGGRRCSCLHVRRAQRAARSDAGTAEDA